MDKDWDEDLDEDLDTDEGDRCARGAAVRRSFGK
jgi:hypothetical protein